MLTSTVCMVVVVVKAGRMAVSRRAAAVSHVGRPELNLHPTKDEERHLEMMLFPAVRRVIAQAAGN